TKQFPIISPDRWIPMAELIKHRVRHNRSLLPRLGIGVLHCQLLTEPRPQGAVSAGFGRDSSRRVNGSRRVTLTPKRCAWQPAGLLGGEDPARFNSSRPSGD